MGGRKSSNRGSSSSSSNQYAAMQAAMAAQAAAAAAAEAERIRQENIAAENAQAQTLQQQSQKQAQQSLTGMQASQQAIDATAKNQQAMANANLGGGAGFDINAARMQALGNVAGAGAVAGITPYAAGPAATNNATATGVNPAVAAAVNQQTGGTPSRQNQFTIPTTNNLTFGGA
jgi:hypothetical protein